jgi:YVTN family beta-propeller protein
MNKWNPFIPAAAVALILVSAIYSQPEGLRVVGPQADGSVILPTGWKIRPAGQQIPTDTFPMASVLSPDKKYLALLHGGYSLPSLVIHEAATLKVVSKLDLPDAWLGLRFAADGKSLFVGGGSKAAVYHVSFSPQGELALAATWPLAAGAVTHEDFTGDVALSPDGKTLYAAMLHRNLVAVVNTSTGKVVDRFKTGRRPYRILMHPDGESFFVSAWADGMVMHHRSSNGEVFDRIRVGAMPMDMVWRGARTKMEDSTMAQPWKGRVFVTASNTNTVQVLSVSESREVKRIENINVSMTPLQPAGSTPSALALSPDEARLYVVCSDLNAVAAVDVEGPKTTVLGFAPVGWYPIAAQVMPDKKLLVFNGRGPRSYPNNVNGPNPVVRPAPLHQGGAPVAYVGRLQKGSITVLGDMEDAAWASQTAAVRQLSPYRDELLEKNNISSNVVPETKAQKSPIEHVIYIIKENRTYDQVLGDLGKGNGDPSLTIFGRDITPNHHKLAEDFVLFDNFYVNADVSADGHNWSTAAIAPAYVQRMWPNSYAGRRKHYDYEGGEPAALGPAGRIWNNALSAGLTVRNYGWWGENVPLDKATATKHTEMVKDPQLAPHTAMQYRGFDLDYTDVDRAKVYLAELKEMEAKGKMPRLTLLKIGNDHTSGLSAGKLSPRSQVADNDLALGMIVEGVSKSKFWAKTAIFVLEDDAQNGPDHIDSHRSPGYIISPYTRRGIIDSTIYNTTSMLRTMELILGLSPMTTYDAGSTPMTRAFASEPKLDAYTLLTPKYSLTERNPAATPLAARSAKLRWDEADEIDDNELNEILWLALKGTTPPVPVRSVFGR